MAFLMPPAVQGFDGSARRVGVEMEYAGVGLEGSAAIVQALFGGRVVPEGKLVYRVVETGLGDFRVELDTLILKDRTYEKPLQRLGIDLRNTPLGESIADVLARLAQVLVPYEIVTPPLAMDQLDRLEELRERLREAGAQGTRSSIRFAFGLHFNPQAWSLEVPVLLDILRAFVLLYDWVVRHGRVDYSRRMLTPFINPFEPAYAAHILRREYQPSLTEFIDDYLRFNPTRNRPLDLLPLLASLQPQRLQELAVGKGKPISPRPAFHYRLANCCVDEPGWTIASEWAHWVAVERLSLDPQRLWAMAEEYLTMQDSFWKTWTGAWSSRAEELMHRAA